MGTTQKVVLDYLNELGPESRTRLIKHFSTEVDEFVFLISSLIDTLQNFQSLNPDYDINNSKQVAYSLMTKSAGTLMAAFEVVLNGYLWESKVLFRSALEGFATAWDIVHNESRFILWNKNNKKFDSTGSISNLKKEIEPFGKMYGFLSNIYVHTNPINASPSYLLIDGEPKLQFFGLIRQGKENVRKSEIYSSLLMAYASLQIVELTFYKYSNSLETIELILGKDIVKTKVSERHAKFVNEAKSHFKKTTEDTSICF